MNRMLTAALAGAALFASSAVGAQETMTLTQVGAPAEPLRIPSSGGEIVLPAPRDKRAYDDMHFAAGRRAGQTLYISGVIAAAPPGKTLDAEGYKVQLRGAFRRIENTLKAAGAGWDDVVMINSFHVWQSPHFSGGRDENFRAVSEVKDEFMKGPHPAWTAVGTSGLLADTGLVEIQMIAHVPGKKD
jgi:enamine deaminase RidA (YjgF/YER057c/UK114 family)